MKSIAYIIDGEIIEIINYDERMASIVLSNPTVVDITKYQINPENWRFDGQNFVSIIDGEEVVLPADSITQ